MNIAALSSRMEMMPDQALAQEMRQPSGSIPQFLILSEMQRRQKMRAGGGGGEAPTSTVAQDLMASATPRPSMGSGIGGGQPRSLMALDTMKRQMQRPQQSMAQGGQVRRFLFGGEVGGGGPPQDRESDLRAILADPSSTADQKLSANIELSTLTAAPLGDAGKFRESMSGMRAPVRTFASRTNPAAEPLLNKYLKKGAVDFDPEAAAMGIFDSKSRPSPSSAGILTRGPFAPSRFDKPYTGQYNFDKPAAEARPAPKRGGGGGGGGGSGGDPARLSSSGIMSGNAASASGSDSGNDMDKWLANIKKLRESELFSDPYAAEQKAEMAALRGEMAENSRQAPWMAVAEAGFKMASGTSPHFATNAGEGLAGLPSALREAKMDELKNKLHLSGMSAKMAEAEAARRMKAVDLYTAYEGKNEDREMRREDALGRREDRALARQLQMAQMDIARWNHADSIAARKDAAIEAAKTRDFSTLATMYDVQARLSDAWDAKNKLLNPDAVNPHLAEMNSFKKLMSSHFNRQGPAAAAPRPAPGKGGRPPLSSFGG